MALAVTALAPFRDPPRLQLGYSLSPGVGASESLALPVVATKFVVPPAEAPPAELFFQRWRALPGTSEPLNPLASCRTLFDYVARSSPMFQRQDQELTLQVSSLTVVYRPAAQADRAYGAGDAAVF